MAQLPDSIARRAFWRYEVALLVQYQSGERTFTASSLNLSQGGMLVRAGAADLTPGRDVVFALTPEHTAFTYSVSGTIVGYVGQTARVRFRNAPDNRESVLRLLKQHVSPLLESKAATNSATAAQVVALAHMRAELGQVESAVSLMDEFARDADNDEELRHGMGHVLQTLAREYRGKDAALMANLQRLGSLYVVDLQQPLDAPVSVEVILDESMAAVQLDQPFVLDPQKVFDPARDALEADYHARLAKLQQDHEDETESVVAKRLEAVNASQAARDARHESRRAELVAETERKLREQEGRRLELEKRLRELHDREQSARADAEGARLRLAELQSELSGRSAATAPHSEGVVVLRGTVLPKMAGPPSLNAINQPHGVPEIADLVPVASWPTSVSPGGLGPSDSPPSGVKAAATPPLPPVPLALPTALAQRAEDGGAPFAEVTAPSLLSPAAPAQTAAVPGGAASAPPVGLPMAMPAATGEFATPSRVSPALFLPNAAVDDSRNLSSGGVSFNAASGQSSQRFIDETTSRLRKQSQVVSDDDDDLDLMPRNNNLRWLALVVLSTLVAAGAWQLWNRRSLSKVVKTVSVVPARPPQEAAPPPRPSPEAAAPKPVPAAPPPPQPAIVPTAPQAPPEPAVVEPPPLPAPTTANAEKPKRDKPRAKKRAKKRVADDLFDTQF